MKTSKCWVWFKGSLNNGGFWKEGFTCTFDEKPGVLIESPAYVTCRVPTWRVLTKEPEDLNKSNKYQFFQKIFCIITKIE